MKTIKLLILMIYIALGFLSCKKQEIKTTPLSSLQITNAVVDGTALQFGTNVNQVYPGSAQAFGVLTGSRQIKLTSVDAPNTTYYDKPADFVNGGVYSLFLTGTPVAVESVFVKEETIVPHTDNVFGVRVINLSLGSATISVNLLGAANGSLFGAVAYKSLSEFKTVSAKAEEGAKTFEFRNAATGMLITSLTIQDYELPRFRNITLVLAGAIGAETVIRVNNY